MTARAPFNVFDEIQTLTAICQPFAVATVVRTVAVTAAKAGAKAVIRSDGAISGGWIGGGCARAAVLKAARECLLDGKPRLISVQPADALQEKGVSAGTAKDGVVFARNMCPSQGTMDIFVEPVLPRPELLIFGSSPVAVALADLAMRLGYLIAVAGALADQQKFSAVDIAVPVGDVSKLTATERYCVVATQGNGDEAALAAALTVPARHVAFVGSRRKADALRRSLLTKGVDADRLADVCCPAGKDIGAVTPEEIALSILAEIVELRRRGQRAATVAPRR